MLTLANLPSPDAQRWIASRKAIVVAAVRGGLLSMSDACARYRLTTEEFLSWQTQVDLDGLHGLRTTRIQEYRGRPPRTRVHDARGPSTRSESAQHQRLQSRVDHRPRALSVPCQQIDQERVFPDSHRALSDLADEEVHELAARRIPSRVSDPGARVSPLASQVQAAVSEVELPAPVQDLPESERALLHHLPRLVAALPEERRQYLARRGILWQTMKIQHIPFILVGKQILDGRRASGGLEARHVKHVEVIAKLDPSHKVEDRSSTAQAFPVQGADPDQPALLRAVRQHEQLVARAERLPPRALPLPGQED